MARWTPISNQLSPALAELNDNKLHALIDVTCKAPRIVPGLLARIDGAAERPLTGADPDCPELAVRAFHPMLVSRPN